MFELAIVGALIAAGVSYARSRRGLQGEWESLIGPETQPALRALKKGDFEPLEQLLASLRQESFSEQDHVVHEIGRLLPVEATKEWVKGRAGDPIAHLLAGSALLAEAWRIRGSDWAKNVPDSAWAGMHENLELAAEHLTIAEHLAPSMPSAPALHLMVARGLSYPPDAQRDLLHRALSADPLHFGAHWTYIVNRSWKWGGDNDEMLSFAREAARKAPAGSPLKGLVVTALAECGLEAAEDGRTSRVIQLEADVMMALKELPDPDAKPNSRCWSAIRRDLAFFYVWTGTESRGLRVLRSATKVAQRF